MTKITNTSQARIALLASFILSPGQSRDASEAELNAMNKPVLLGLIKEDKLSAPDIEKALAEAAAPVAEAAAPVAEADKEPAKTDKEPAKTDKEPAKKPAGGMPNPGKK